MRKFVIAVCLLLIAALLWGHYQYDPVQTQSYAPPSIKNPIVVYSLIAFLAVFAIIQFVFLREDKKEV